MTTDQHQTTPFKNASTKSVGNGGWRPCLRTHGSTKPLETDRRYLYVSVNVQTVVFTS